MTFTEMDSLVLGYCGGRTDATFELRKLFLNNAQNELAVAFFFDTLENVADAAVTTVAATPSVTTPATNYYITTVNNATKDNAPLTRKDWAWYQQQDWVNSSGEPEYFVEYAGKMYFYPTPDDAYVMRISGVKLPTPMDETHACPFPLDWHIIVVLAGSADLLFYLKDLVQAQALRNEQLAKINSRTEVQTFRNRQQGGQVTVDRRKPLNGVLDG